MNNQFSRLQTLFDQTISGLQDAQAFVTELAKREARIEESERSLGVRGKSFDAREQKLTETKGELDRSRAYLEQENARISKAQAQLDFDKKELQDLEKQKSVVDERQRELAKHELALSLKIKSLEGLVAKERELEEREAKLAKEVAVDRERKRILDLRVQRIKEREKQLQMDDEIADL